MNTESNKRIQIVLDKNQKLTVSAEQVYLPEAIQLCLAAIEALCKETLKRTDDEKLIQSLEEDMYEMINLGASTLLNKLFPEIDMRPDLTVDAIMQAENNLINDKDSLQIYANAYDESAQSKKDVYEHATVAANLKRKEKQSKKNK